MSLCTFVIEQDAETMEKSECGPSIASRKLARGSDLTRRIPVADSTEDRTDLVGAPRCAGDSKNKNTNAQRRSRSLDADAVRATRVTR